MRVNSTLAQQACAVIHIEVAARLWEKFFHPTDFVDVFCHMRLNPDIRKLLRDLTRAVQLFWRAGGGKTGGDGVTQAVHTVPAGNQRLGLAQTGWGVSVAQAIGAVAVLQHFAGDHAQAAFLGLGHEHIHGLGVRGGKAQRRGHAVSHQLIQEEVADFVGIAGRCKLFFVRKSVVLQPGQQAVSG